VTVFFSEPPVGLEKQGPEDYPENLAQRGIFQLSPQHPGELIWIDARTLQFIPTIPWTGLARFTVTVQGNEHQLVTFMRDPVNIEPYPSSNNLDPLQEMTISFAEALNVEAVAAMLMFEIKDLPGVEGQQSLWLTQEDFDIKQIERSALSEPVQYQLTFHKAITFGKQITLHLKLSLDETIEGAFAQYTFSTKPVFRITGIGSEYTVFPIAAGGSVYSIEQPLIRNGNSEPVFIEFSDQLAPITLAEVKRFVRFDPAVEDFTFEISGQRLYLYFNSDSDKVYKLSLHEVPFKDDAGRVLAFKGASQLYFYYPHADPFLRWKYSQGIVERYGPQQFPMEGRPVLAKNRNLPAIWWNIFNCLAAP